MNMRKYWKGVHERILRHARGVKAFSLSELSDFSQIQNHLLHFYYLSKIDDMQREINELKAKI